MRPPHAPLEFRLPRVAPWRLALLLAALGGCGPGSHEPTPAAPASGEPQPRSPWSGEWGQWGVSESGQHGASLSIFDCDTGGSRCRLRLDAETAESRCGAGDPDGVALVLDGPSSGHAQLARAHADSVDCRVELQLQNTEPPVLHAALRTGGCPESCTGAAPELGALPRRADGPFPARAVRDCFADARGTRRLWCSNAELQALEDSLVESNRRIQEFFDPFGFGPWIRAKREIALQECETSPEPRACLQQQLAAVAEELRPQAELATPGDPALAERLSGELEGAYNDATQAQAYAPVLLARLPGSALFLEIALVSESGSMCVLDGVARFSRAGVFVHRRAAEQKGAPPCVLQLKTGEAQLRLVASETCDLVCGAHASLDGFSIPLGSRQPLRDRQALEASPEYQEALQSLGSPWR